MSLLIFLGVLSSLVIVHEWGHYITARKLGIGVHRFSIGFGPVLFRRQGKHTEFCVSLIPLGGYVKLEGEESKEVKGGPSEFGSRPAWQRFLVVFAGPALNAVLAFLIFTGIFMAGNPTYSTVVGKVLDGYPSQQAGIREGDRLVRMNGTEVKMWEDLLAFLAPNGPKQIDAEILREGQAQHVMITPRVEEIRSIFGKRHSPARIGIMPSGEVIYVKSGPAESIGLGARKVGELTGLIFKSLGMLITGQATFKDSMTGPIGRKGRHHLSDVFHRVAFGQSLRAEPSADTGPGRRPSVLHHPGGADPQEGQRQDQGLVHTSRHVPDAGRGGACDLAGPGQIRYF